MPSKPRTTCSHSHRIYSSYSNLITSCDQASESMNRAIHFRRHLTLPRSTSSSILIDANERRKELDLLLKQISNGKLLNTVDDHRSSSDISDLSGSTSKQSLATTTMKSEHDSRLPRGNLSVRLIRVAFTFFFVLGFVFVLLANFPNKLVSIDRRHTNIVESQTLINFEQYTRNR
jgi:hypothetical protein